MNDSSFVLFAVAALFLMGLGWFLLMDEREFSQQDEDDAIEQKAQKGARREAEATATARLSA